MKSEDELGDWWRTHYSSQVTPDLDGKEVTVFGWVSSVRTQGGITFLIVNDKEGIFQVTTIRGKSSDALVEKMGTIASRRASASGGSSRRSQRPPTARR